MNVILDLFFIFNLNFGASGTALGTLISQYIALVPSLLALNRRVRIDIVGRFSQLKDVLM